MFTYSPITKVYKKRRYDIRYLPFQTSSSSEFFPSYLVATFYDAIPYGFVLFNFFYVDFDKISIKMPKKIVSFYLWSCKLTIETVKVPNWICLLPILEGIWTLQCILYMHKCKVLLRFLLMRYFAQPNRPLIETYWNKNNCLTDSKSVLQKVFKHIIEGLEHLTSHINKFCKN